MANGLTDEEQTWLDLLMLESQGTKERRDFEQSLMQGVADRSLERLRESPAPTPSSILARPPGLTRAGAPLDSGLLSSLNWVKERTLVPAVETAQKYVGSPIMEAYLGLAGFDSTATLPGNITLAGTPEELVARSAVKPFAGEQVKSAPGSRILEARERAGAAAPVLEVGGEILGLAATAPFTPTAAPVKVTSVLGRVLAAAKHGAIIGGAQALGQRGKPVEQGLTEGALFGGAFRLGTEGVKAGVKFGPVLLGKLRAPDVKQLAQEALVLPDTPELPTKPSIVVLSAGEEGPTAKLIEISDSGLKSQMLPLRTADEVARVQQLGKGAPHMVDPTFEPYMKLSPEVPADWDTPMGKWMDMDLVRGKNGRLQLRATGEELFPAGKRVVVHKASGETLTGTVIGDSGWDKEVLVRPPRINTEKLVSTAQAPFPFEQAIADRINAPTVKLRVPAHQLSSLPEPPLGRPAPFPRAPAFQNVPLGEPTPTEPVTLPQIGRDPRSGAVGPPGGGAGPPPGSSAPAFNTGELVYLDQASPRRTTTYTTVEVLGTKQNGKVEVKLTSDQGNPIIKEVDPERLTHVKTVPPVTGAAPKAPMPIPGAGQIPAQTLDEFNRTKALMDYASRNPGLWAKVKQFLMAPGLRPGEDIELARKALALRAARRVEETAQDNLRSFRQAAGNNFKFLGDFDRDIEKVVLGQAPASSLAKHGEIWQRTKRQVQDMLQERDYLNDKLASMGYVPQELQSLRDVGAADNYAARMYFSKLLEPGEWADNAPQKVVLEGQDFLRRQAEKRGIYMTDPEVSDEVRKLLGAKDPLEALRASPLGKPFQHLKRLQDLPEPLRNLMGEVRSGTYRLATSLGIQRSLVSQLTLMEEIAANPKWASIGPQPGFIQLPDLAAYGKARNMFVSPEVAEAVVNLPDTIQRGQAIIQSLIGMTKQNIITTSPRAHVRQNIQSFLSAVLAGGMDITHPERSRQNLVKAARIMQAYKANPSGSGLAELMQEAKALGAVDVGFGSAEVKGAQAKMLDAVANAIVSPQAKNLWGLFPKLREISGKFYDKAGRAYEAPDQFFRLASYLAQREKLLNAGMPLKVAREEAARRVAMSFVSPGNVSDAVNKMRRGAGGVINPWLTSIVEDARIAATLPQRLMTEPDLKWRLGVTGMVLAGGYGGLRGLQHLNGISDEEVDAARTIQPRSQQSFRTAQLPLAWRDEKGRVQFMDMSWMHTGLQLLRGDPQDAMWRRVLAQTLYLPVSGGGLEGTARSLIESTGLVSPTEPSPELREGEAGLMRVMQQLNGTGLFGPIVIGEAARTGQHAGLWGYQSPNREQLTPGQAASKMFGIPIAPITVPKTAREDSPSLRGSFAEDRRYVRSLKNQYRSLMATDKSREAVMKRAEELYKRMQERDEALQKFQKSQAQGGAK